MKVVHGSRYRKSRMRMFALLFVVALTIVALVFARPNSDTLESRTEGWGAVSFADYGIGLRFPDEYRLISDGQTLVSLEHESDSSLRTTMTVYASSEQESLTQWLKRVNDLEGAERTVGENTSAVNAIDANGAANIVFEHQERIVLIESTMEEELLNDFLDSLSLSDSPPAVDASGRARLLELTDIAFKELHDASSFPNTTRITEKPPITGDAGADAHIQMLAEARGYRLQTEAGEGLDSADGYSLQKQTADAWRKLQAAAAEEGIFLSVTSGYRSVASQQQIFVSRLAVACGEAYGSNCSNEQIANAEADAAIDEVLKTSSIPGYSRHHSGHTVDIGQDGVGAFEDFFGTPGWDWISANNYENAKRFGFIPSYPPNAGLQGPDPEPWEYVYIGPSFFRIGE